MPHAVLTNKRLYMKFEFTGRHIAVTPALRAHVKEHFERSRFLLEDRPIKAHVIIEVEKGRHRSEIILKWRDKTLTAHTSMSDMYQSLSKTVEKLEKQVLKSKDKLIDKHHKGKKLGVAATSGKARKAASKIVAERAYRVRPMSPEDAVDALRADTKGFIVFRNAETMNVAVLYKRKNGDFGLISV